MSLIRTDYIISPYSAEQSILEISGDYFTINTDAKKLIEILSVSKNYQEATHIFNSDFQNINLNENEFIRFIENIFAEIPIFNSSSLEVKKTKSFIKFQRTLLSPSIASQLANCILFLFNKKVFWIIFPVLFISGIFTIIATPVPYKNISPLWIFVFYTLSIFFHELGHIAACKKYTRQNGEIGFGIYFLFPVLYSNISAIWHGSKEERIITNLAGIYMQLWCMLCFYVAYWFTQNETALFLTYFTAVYCIIQIFPFIRSDGYWLLSDISSTSNLLGKSGKEVKLFIKHPLQWLREKREKKIFLLIYGLFNTLILTYFIVYQVLFHWKDILYFPITVLDILKLIFTLQFSHISLPDHFIVTSVFYLLLFTQIKNLFSRFSQKKETA
ncbi:hypothetical protein [Chryseobacterium sp.]|uniref:hypothetical protein n=1 Tax=Chryseobacterium sp. TaxID=1871047 RepID=UPI0025BFA933|nr:hypothetical protein [Chryseobacterium sp.]